jgi:Tfp pilus assembly protein PilP
MKIALLALTAALLVAAPAAAQIPAAANIPIGTRVGDSAPNSIYDSAGRRDPFVTLVAPRRPTSGTGLVNRARTGLASLALADVSINGLARVGKTMMAILEGPNKTSFTAKVGDRIADAQVKSIDTQGVVFVEMYEGGGRGQEIRKTLRSAAEGVR